MISFIMDNGHAVERDQVKVFKSGKMEGNMKVIGKGTREMETEDVFIQMVIIILDNGKMIWLMV